MKRSSRSGILIWALLAVGIALFLAWALGGDRPRVPGQAGSEFGYVVYLGAILVLVASGLVGRAVRPGQVIRAVLFWSLLGSLLAGGYAYRTELMGVGGRILGALAPGVPITGALIGDADSPAVVITRGRNGHFSVWGEVDDQSVSFLVDTGASFVTFSSREAARLGVDVDSLRFTLPIRTANGTIRAAPITIDNLTIGAIRRQRVRGLVAPPGALAQSLLGLSFLDSLQSYTVAGDRLILTP